MQEKNKHCCQEHLDIAFDDFLDEFEVFPHMVKAGEEKCDYCSRKAEYALILPNLQISQEDIRDYE